jgi:hypothetical protein
LTNSVFLIQWILWMPINGWCHRKIRLIEGNSRCRLLTNLSVKGLCGRCLSVWGSKPHTPPPYTLYTCKQYTLSHREGGSVGELYQREG